jgi:hydrogenase maturation factor
MRILPGRTTSDAGFYGKVPNDVMNIVYRNLGAKRRQVLRGPKRGLDNAVLSLPGGKVMILTTDPVSMIPALGSKMSAWLSVHLIASDYTTSGTSPEFASFTFNFPVEMKSSERKSYLENVGMACKEIGVSIIAGHTGSYPGADFTVIGGGTMFGVAERGAYVDSSMAREGDLILMTKGAAIEATASLASSFPRVTEKALGGSLAKKARALMTSCSTVRDALAAASVGLGEGGVTSMHDATEGGVLGAMDEMAFACGKSFVVDPHEIPIAPEARGVCSTFGLDPLRTMGEGALILTCSRTSVAALEDSLAHAEIPVAMVGIVQSGSGLVLSESGKKRKRYIPGPDEYWAAYDTGVRKGLS